MKKIWITGLIIAFAMVIVNCAHNSDEDDAGNQAGNQTPAAVTAPLTVTDITANSVSLSWPSVSGANSYEIKRSTSYDFSSSTNDVTALLTYTASGLNSGWTYYFRVTALNSSGSVISDVGTVWAMPNGSSGINITVTAAAENSISFEWTSVSGADSCYYRIEYSKTSSFDSVVVCAEKQSAATYTVSGLSAGTNYYFRVTALNSSGTVIGVGSASTKTDEPAAPAASYSKEYWGEWVRMDTGASWIITNNKITTGASAAPVTATLTKQSARVIKAASNGKEIYLFAARIANSGFTGKINIEGSASAQIAAQTAAQTALLPGISRSTTSGVSVTVTNKNNPSLTKTATTGADGSFAVEEIIPGDEYTVSAGGQTAPVLPTAPDVDVGTITFASGINFKTTVTPASDNTTDMMQMYAKESSYDTSRRYSFVINLHNSGTVSMEGGEFALTPEEGITIVSQPDYPYLGSILPGASGEIPITVACEPLTTEDNVLKKINITLTGVSKTWNDSVSFRFNKQPVTFYIASKNPTQGVIITPYSKAYQFSTDKISPGNGNSYVTSVTLPWSKQDYLAVFSGASLDMETTYSFGVNTQPSAAWNTTGLVNAGETANNTEAGATPLQTGDSYLAFLHSGDIDFYKISLGNTPPAPAPSGIFDDAVNAPPSDTTLTSGTWENGNITSSGGEQWFSFTATSSTQYIHVKFGTLTDLYVQLYNSSGTTAIGSETNLYSSTKYKSVSVTSGQTYRIKVWQYSYGSGGTYQIAFNTSSTAPN